MGGPDFEGGVGHGLGIGPGLHRSFREQGKRRGKLGRNAGLPRGPAIFKVPPQGVQAGFVVRLDRNEAGEQGGEGCGDRVGGKRAKHVLKT